MKVLSINAGSSSMKFTAYEMPEENVLISGYIERIGIGEGAVEMNTLNKRMTKTAKRIASAFGALLVGGIGLLGFAADAEACTTTIVPRGASAAGSA